jgi:hypothetical protein
MKKSCKSRQIRKKSYKTKKSVKVQKILPKPKSGILEQYGYKNIKELSAKKREEILEKAAKQLGYKDIIKHLTLIHNLSYRSHPNTAKLMKQDQEKISKIYKNHK